MNKNCLKLTTRVLMLLARPNVNRSTLVVASQLQRLRSVFVNNPLDLPTTHEAHEAVVAMICVDDLCWRWPSSSACMDRWLTASANRCDRDPGIEAHPRRLPPRALEASPARGREVGPGRRLRLCVPCKVTGAPPPTRSPMMLPRRAPRVPRPASSAQATPVASLVAARPTAVSILPLIASARTSPAACNHARIRHRRSMPPSGFATSATIRTLTFCTRRPKRLRASRTRRITIVRTTCDTRTSAAVTSIFKVLRVA
jgi:hypothetical protein